VVTVSIHQSELQVESGDGIAEGVWDFCA
jgi:hypothetical protein